MWTRDQIVSTFGLKRSTEIRAEAERKGIDTISAFPVISRTARETIVGEMDSHLDFQTSVLIRDRLDAADDGSIDESKELVATTVVHCHGLFGKAYITLIRVFHVVIVRYSLARVPYKISSASLED